MPRGRKAARPSIDAAQFDVHEADEPIASLGFHETDGLPVERPH
jgi:hypothetical protein